MHGSERGRSPNGEPCRRPEPPERKTAGKESVSMSKHYNPLEKEYFIHKYKRNPGIKLSEFCEMNHISTTAFKIWMRKYEEEGLEGLARSGAEKIEVLPEGVERTEEAYRREILKLRIENERLKKNYTVRTGENGEKIFVRLEPRNMK